jgi:ribA/ribD-fused uncharacterized protein
MKYAPIKAFVGEFFFLSNFSEEGKVKPTVEHWFQAGKAASPREAAKVMAAATPGQAKKLGRRVSLREDWEEIKIEFMRGLLYEKFADPEIQAKLIETNPHPLIEGNNWGDDFWGDCSGAGLNHLGKLLEEVRYWYLAIT